MVKAPCQRGACGAYRHLPRGQANWLAASLMNAVTLPAECKALGAVFVKQTKSVPVLKHRNILSLVWRCPKAGDLVCSFLPPFPPTNVMSQPVGKREHSVRHIQQVVPEAEKVSFLKGAPTRANPSRTVFSARNPCGGTSKHNIMCPRSSLHLTKDGQALPGNYAG